MTSAEREPITGVWGRALSGVQGQSPWSGALSWQHFSVCTLEESVKFASLFVFCNISALHHGYLVGLFYAFITSFTKFIIIIIIYLLKEDTIKRARITV